MAREQIKKKQKFEGKIGRRQGKRADNVQCWERWK